jgi:amino acid adenylation domain-containing protein/non-ribosomal peptide synthase protein (TIGR01720 family)
MTVSGSSSGLAVTDPDVLFDLPNDRVGRLPADMASTDLAGPHDISEAVGAWASRDGAEPAATVVAAFRLLLARWSGHWAPPVVVERPDGAAWLTSTIDPESSFGALVAASAGELAGGAPPGTGPYAALSLGAAPAATPGAAPLLRLRLADERAAGAAIEYDRAVYSSERITWMATSLRTLLRAAHGAPDTAVGDLAVADDDVLAALSATTPASHAGPDSVDAFFRQRVTERPEAIACRDRHGELSYRDLDAWASRIAHRLRAAGVGPGSLVPVSVSRRVALPAALLGVLRAGAAYVPIDRRNPQARNRLVLDAAGAVTMLTDGEPPVPDHGLDIVDVDAVRPRTDEQVSALDQPAGPLAYVIFTSGSTGRPKGVQVGNAALAATMAAMQELVGIRPGGTCLALTTVSFDIAALELFLPLCSGATVEIAADDVAPDPGAVADRLNQAAPDLVQATPTMWRAVIDAGWRGDDAVTVLCGGEELAADLAAELRKRAGRLWNVYGPTETTIWSTAADLTEAEAEISIGRPVPGERVHVTDARGNRVGPGMVGELWIGGAGIAEGYLGRPELTARQFIADPFTPGGRIYRTGDLAELRADGTLRFRGRRDSQIKLRGHRIELEEIETVLRADPGVLDAVVVLQGTTSADHRLVAFLRPAPDGVPSVAAVFARAAQVLPAVMVPAAGTFLTAWPVTASGKIDRNALRALDVPAEVPAADGELPDGPVEEEVAAVYAEVLSLADVRADTDFFAAGGHSLLANRVVTRLRSVGLSASLRDLFEAPTVSALAKRLSREPVAPLSPAAGPALAQAPLSFAQERLWFLDRVGASGPEHHVQAAFRLHGPVHEALLEDALRRIVARHEPLRTVFGEVDGRAVQTVVDAVDIDLPVTPVADEEEARQIMRALHVEPFDLTEAPLLRAELFRAGPEEHLLYLCIHHICTDGWSMGRLAAEIIECYTAALVGREPELPALHLTYRDYAAAERAAAERPEFAARLDQVTRRLAELPIRNSITLDRARPQQQSLAGATVRARLSADATAALRALGRRQGTTLHSVLLAAYAALLHRFGAPAEMIIAVPGANRDRPEVEDMVGVFVNTLAVPVRVDAGEPFPAFVSRVGVGALELLEAADVPFDRVVEALQVPRNLAALPLTQVAFVMHNVPMPAIALPGVSVTSLPLDTGLSMYDLRLVATEDPDGLAVQLDHATSVILPSTAAALLDHLVEALDLVARDGAGDGPLTIAAGTEIAAPVTAAAELTTVGALFAGVVRVRGDAPAVSSGREVWTYRQLDEAGWAVSAALRRAGVEHGATVAVFADHGLDLAAILLGVVRLGAAYVCVDHRLPEQRIDFILDDAACGVVLTDHAGRESAARTGLTVVDVTEVDYPTGTAPADPPVVGPDDVAYITYTSGSTGRPKGTLVPHRAIAGFFTGVDYAEFGPSTVMLGYSSTSWDAFTLELWSSVLTGGRCHLVPGGLSGPEDLVRHRREGGTNTAWITAAFFNALVDADPGAFEGFRQILVGGEALSLRHIRAFRAHHPGMRLVNGYGPSECTVFTTCHVIPAEIPTDWTAVPIGRPIGDRQVLILDDRGREVPDLVTGELHVGGPAVALGYLNRPELQREKFVELAGRRLYRSGDRVRRRRDGLIEFLGRDDDQVKLRGYRIELGEIEQVVAGHPAVGTAVVVLHVGERGTPRLAAYVTPAAGSGPDLVAELRRHLRSTLPDYMVPSAIQVLAELPRLSTGKVHRAALPEPDFGAGETTAEDDDRITALAGIWAEVLGLESVGPDDNFFDIGGDSIASIQVVVRARDAGITLQPRDLFTAQTVRSVLRSAGGAPAPEADQQAQHGEIPLSPIQRWMFELDLRDVNRLPQSLLLDFTADPGEDRLRQALDAVANHHDMLRARFRPEADGWVQEYGPESVEVPLTRAVVDPAGDLSAQIEEIVAEVHDGVDIIHGPLVRAAWIDTGDGAGKLFLVCHHLAVDGYSWNIILEDLFEALRRAPGTAPAPKPKTSSYRQWVELLQRWADSAEAQRQVPYWRAVPDAGLPRLLPPAAEPERALLTTTLSAELAGRLRTVPSAYEVEPVEVMIAALARALLRDSGRHQLAVELEHHGRDLSADGASFDRTVGWFTSLYPVTVEAPDDPAEALKAVKNAVRAVPDSGRGYGILRYLGGMPVTDRADVRFNYLGRFDALASLADGVTLSSHSLGDHASRPKDGGLPLSVTSFLIGDRLQVRWDHRADRIPPERMRAIAEVWADEVDRLTSCALASTGPALVPADFPLAGLDQAALDNLLEGL